MELASPAIGLPARIPIRSQVTEGTSALFLVTEQADVDRLAERMRGVHTMLLATNLTDAERKDLLETFGDA